jgi:hypothetical protein
MEAAIEIPDASDKSEAMTPLIESVAKMYSEPPSTSGPSPFTSSSSELEEVLDSPSVYSMCSDDGERLFEEEEEPIHQPFLDPYWANAVQAASMDEVPEGRLLPTRVATIQLKGLLRRRREEAGLPEEGLDSPDDY